MEMIDPSAVSSAQQLKLYANEKNLFVEDENAAYRVERHDMNPLLREVMHRQAMGKFIGDGYIRVNKFEDGKYELMAKVRGDGGFLLTGVIVHQSCRVIGYSGILLGGGSAIVAGFVAGGPVGAVTSRFRRYCCCSTSCCCNRIRVARNWDCGFMDSRITIIRKK